MISGENRLSKIRVEGLLSRITPALAKIGVITKSSLTTPTITQLDDVLQAEIFWYQRRLAEKREANDRVFAEQVNEELAAAEGALIECQCCCSEFAFEVVVQCSDGHLFCRHCLQKYAEQTLFGDGRTQLKCMCTTETCTGHFSERTLAVALPPQVLAKLEEAITKKMIAEANLEDIITCHSCSLQVELPMDAGKVLTCPKCAKQTCRDCKDEAHVPLKCSEVERKAQKDTRVTIEEAMTEARLRECKKCKARFFKTEGCNKMVCACGAAICYVCRKDISKELYKHFCQAPHCDHKKCDKCILFSNSVEDDKRAMYEAGLRVASSSDALPVTTNDPKKPADADNVVGLF